MKQKIYVCVKCGCEVSGACLCYDNDDPKYAFCGNCGDSGSHQKFTTKEKWQAAQKLMGMPYKINDYLRD